MSESLDSIADRIRRHPKLVIADDFEIVLEKTAARGVRYHNGDLRSSSESQRLWVSLRILHRKRGGKAQALNPTDDTIGFLVEAAFESANRSTVDPWFRFPIWKTLKEIKPAAPEESFSYTSLYPSLSGSDAILDESYEEQAVEMRLRRKTEKIELKHQRSVHRAGFSLLAHRESEGVLVEEEHAGQTPLRQREEWLAALVQTADKRQNAKPCGRGKRKVVLAPRVASRILRLMTPWFLADAAQAGRSPLATSTGQSILPSCLTLCDDGNHPESVGSSPFDLEGIATQRTVLVDKGVLKSWLYDVYCATRENRLSTGSRLRVGGETHPRIAPSTAYWNAGELSRQAVLEKMGNGVYLDILGSLTPIGGETSRYIARGSGWRIAFGHQSEPLTDIEFEFDPLQLMQSASAVGRDLTFFAGCGSPSILLEEVPLGI